MPALLMTCDECGKPRDLSEFDNGLHPGPGLMLCEDCWTALDDYYGQIEIDGALSELEERDEDPNYPEGPASWL